MPHRPGYFREVDAAIEIWRRATGCGATRYLLLPGSSCWLRADWGMRGLPGPLAVRNRRVRLATGKIAASHEAEWRRCAPGNSRAEVNWASSAGAHEIIKGRSETTYFRQFVFQQVPPKNDAIFFQSKRGPPGAGFSGGKVPKRVVGTEVSTWKAVPSTGATPGKSDTQR